MPLLTYAEHARVAEFFLPARWPALGALLRRSALIEVNPDHASANHSPGQVLEEQGRFAAVQPHYGRAGGRQQPTVWQP